MNSTPGFGDLKPADIADSFVGTRDRVFDGILYAIRRSTDQLDFLVYVIVHNPPVSHPDWLACHAVELGVWPHIDQIGHPVGQREETGNCTYIPDVFVVEAVLPQQIVVGIINKM